MPIPLKSPQDFGLLVRATRQAERLRQDDAAGAIGVSDVFLWKVEKGSPGVRLDKLLQVLDGLGIRLQAEVSPAAEARYGELLEKAARPRPVRRRKAEADTGGEAS